MSYENPSYFLSDQNIQMLWEVILDDDIVVNKNREEVTLINNLFLRVAQQFNDREKTLHKSLISMNKNFISVIVSILNERFPKPKPLVIHEAGVLITAQDIQANKLNEFEQEFTRKQEEFTRAMTLPVPEKPNFTDNAKDEPLSELDAIIKRTIAERNLEMQQITNTYNKQDVESWIKSSETSVRSEKTRENQNAMETIKIEKNINNYDSLEKKLTWAKDLTEDITSQPRGLKLKITELDLDKNTDLSASKNSAILIEKRLEKLESKMDLIYSLFQNLLEEKIKIDFEN